MIEMVVTVDMMAEAYHRAMALGVLENSILKGTGNLSGFLGEIAAANYLRAGIVGCYSHDLTHRGQRYEVKSKQTTVVPLPTYEASVANHNPSQACDWYIFTRVYWPQNGPPVAVYLMGYIARLDYFQRATFLKVGAIDPSNGYAVRSDCWNLPYSELRPMEELL